MGSLQFPISEKSLHSAIKRVLGLVDPCSVQCGKVRIGGRDDGGYVMANDFSRNRIAYSIGVGVVQVYWDVDMANRGMEIYQYDHTVDGSPEYHDSFRFFKHGIGVDDTSDPDLITLEKMLKDNGHYHNQNMILKMDVEHAEWDVLLAMDVELLRKFDQIVMELHGLSSLRDKSFRVRAAAVFEKLSKYHRCIHVHANNYALFDIVGGVPFPDSLEVTYCTKDKFQFLEEPDFFPTEYDCPCNPDAPDFYLGQFKFR